MGVPHFYTWLVTRYPLIKSLYNEATLPLIDWFFMDLNGVIYKCAMDDTFAFKDMVKGRRFEEIFMHIFNYVNEIIHLIQPQKMIFLAFDGVAPRAKMNQQRARRFKSARKYQELDDALRAFGIIEKEEHFKNNSISPGTEFMHELSKQMRFFIQKKMVEDDRWRKLQVIFSGVEVPGEGEHKTLEYIRIKTQEPGFDPNTSICIYGPDADLIMLALTTHLPFVCIFREQLKPRARNTSACKRMQKKDSFDFLWINMLREYFEIEFSPLKEKMGARFNVAKIIDDFIFLCFFIGNDFLPRVFCMDIKIGTFDKLIEIFKDTLIENDGYINEKGVICWYRAVNLFKKIAEFELKFINDKLEEQESQQRNINRFKDAIQEIDSMTEEDNRELMAEVEQLKEEYKDFEEIEKLEKEGKGSKEKKLEELIEGAPKKKKNLPTHGSKGNLEEEKAEEEDLVAAGLATVEDAENYLLTHTNEEKISKLLSTQVLEKDIKFMSSLVKIYRTNKSNARLFYYEGKFDVDVEKTPHELTRILTAYMQGLQFVLSYYYTGCPSWMWFYPYYYSPLISDLSNLMTHLNLPHSTDNLITFDYGKAYDPYKQLLLILPIVSLHLLPEPLRQVVADENSPLYSYYPHEFEVDPFGAVFESEYIAKVPFVDEKLLDSEYAKAIRQVALSGEEIHRNSLGTNYLYEWDQKLPETEVKSALPIYFDNFKVRVKMSTFMLEDFPFDPKKILDGIPPGSQSYHSSYPSLHFIPDKKVEMTEFMKKNVTFYKCCFKVSETAGPGNVQDYRKLLERPFFCMYPFLTPCVILGIITPDQLITNLNYNDLPFPYTKSEHKNYYKDITANVHDTYFNESGVLFDKEDPVFALINCESELRKDSLGNMYCPYPIFDVIPLALIMSSNFKSYYRGDIDLSQKDLPKEFPKFTDVVINMGNNVGAVGKVTGYIRNNFDFDQVEVRIFKLPLNLSNVTKSIAEKYDSHHNYSSAAAIANQLGIDVGVLLTVLDFIVIKTEPAVDGKSIYPERFDLGLNLIQRKNHTIVPELIICHELDRQKKSRSFPHFQLSVEAVEIVKEYYRLHKPIFTALARKLETRDTSVLTAEYIYPSSRDPNLELLKVYMWIIKLDIANLVLANKASKVIPREGIQEIEAILKKQDHEQADQVKQAASKPLTFNPNYLFPKHPDSWVPPLFYKKPPWHNIGDRVVNLKINGFSFAPFGASGTVVGILGNKPENGTLEVKIEVMFDQPFLGGTNLGGRCTWGKGAVVDFDDIFNINSWYKFIKPRDRRRDYYFQGWDGVISRSYVPTFQTTDDTPEAEEGQTKPFQGPPANKSFAVLTRDLKSIPQQTIAPQDAQYKEYSQADMLKQLQQFQGSLPGANQPQNQPPVQGQQLTQAEMMKQLQQFQGGITGSTQIQTQPQKPTQSQTQSIQPPSTQGKPVIPKTLGLKQPTQNAPKPSSQAEHHKPAHTTTTSTTFEPKGGPGFDFNSFLSSNLAQNTPVQTALQTAKPSTTSAPMSEDQIKGALNLGNDPNKNKKNLNTGSKTFNVVSREQRNPAPQVVYVEKKAAPKTQESNPLAAFISSSSGLPISQGKLPETAKAVGVDQVETANKLHEVSQLLGGLNQPPINVNPVDVSQVEVKNQFDKMSQLLGTTGQTNPPPQKGFDVSEMEKNSTAFQLHQMSQMLGNQGQGAQIPAELKPVDVSHIEQGTQAQDAQGQSQPETGTNQESNA